MIALRRQLSLILVLISIVVIMSLSRIVVSIIIFRAHFAADATDHILMTIADIFGQLRFDCMALGALGAVGLTAFRNGRSSAMVALFAEALFSKQMQIVVFSFLGYSLLSGKDFVLLDQQVYSVLFLWVIINIGANPSSILKFESALMRWLGRISYGLYCYNWICIVSAIIMVRAVFPRADAPLAQICMQWLAIFFTIMAAQLSYSLLEQPFLRLKHYVSPPEVR